MNQPSWEEKCTIANFVFSSTSPQTILSGLLLPPILAFFQSERKAEKIKFKVPPGHYSILVDVTNYFSFRIKYLGEKGEERENLETKGKEGCAA